MKGTDMKGTDMKRTNMKGTDIKETHRPLEQHKWNPPGVRMV
jgi:hypothetical protein